MFIRMAVVLLMALWLGYRYFVTTTMTSEDLTISIITFVIVWFSLNYSIEIKAVLK
ncbi:hypothetical protein LS684_09675 [Cytobacillus spongiae]|uniref:hypothetical protein n=1 Tax=Cytobacillus spongiae TaxID=2901381 RepID=UPI001F49256E|nr:hypothetical protein [Cytobacillus spongiae]UII57663.1 hypothetical protein LS684_09675 [Cytobacillus spongiae]